jgi:hypothetical protein
MRGRSAGTQLVQLAGLALGGGAVAGGLLLYKGDLAAHRVLAALIGKPAGEQTSGEK